MNTTRLYQPSSFKPPFVQDRTRLLRSCWWICLGVFLPMGSWMVFALLCSVIIDDLTTELDQVQQQQAQVKVGAAAAKLTGLVPGEKQK